MHGLNATELAMNQHATEAVVQVKYMYRYVCVCRSRYTCTCVDR